MNDLRDPQKFLRTLSRRPGVYRMLAGDGEVLYVGKARNLKSRVSTYFGRKAHLPKTQALMNHTADVKVTVTGTEREALLLEYNLIKEHRPRFNVLLRDGKSYPYIRVTVGQEYPRFEFHRGARRPDSRYFGPFPNAGAVRKTLGQLQKLFRVRQCEDSYFKNRSRPCLQYQIKRCTAPCVGFIERDEYRRDVDSALLFLAGKNDAVIDQLIGQMDRCAADRNYEQAAVYRDRIAAIREIQGEQGVTGEQSLAADVVCGADLDGRHCVVVIMIRGGRMLGSRTFFPRTAPHTEPGEVLSAFLVQHYFTQTPPQEVITNIEPDDQALLEEAFAERAEKRVRIRQNVRGVRRRWLEIATKNVAEALAASRANRASRAGQLESLADLLGLDDPPERIECFDISHTGGEQTVASCVVFGSDGAQKSAYRRFNIGGVEPGDDYAAIGQVVERRYARVRSGDAPLPDLIVIDGGGGQVASAEAALRELGLKDIPLIGIAKGPGRRPGREKIYRAGEKAAVAIPDAAPGFLLLQEIRDEAHRFAVAGHRQKRKKSVEGSVLQEIRGLGPARRRALLERFGGLQGVRRAGIEDLSRVPGISSALAQRIYDHFHGGVR